MQSPRQYDPARVKMCDSCPHQSAKENFKNETKETIGFRLGWVEAERYKFEELLETFYQVIRLEDLQLTRLSVKSAALLNLYRAEKNRFEREQEAARRSQPEV